MTSDKKEFDEGYLQGAVTMSPYQPGKHCHETVAGLTGWSQPAPDGQHWHPTVDGKTTLAVDKDGHQHQTPSNILTGERQTTW